MAGLGQHYSTTEGQPVTGHSLVAGLDLLVGRQCPVAPPMYRQRAVSEAEGVPFPSQIEQGITTFEPRAGTCTHGLLDSWYAAQAIGKAARARGVAISSGLKSNRWLGLDDGHGGHGQKLSAYAAGWRAEDDPRVTWLAQSDPRAV